MVTLTAKVTLESPQMCCAQFTYICVLLFPVCSDSNTHQKESCVHWQESKCPNKTGETGGSRGMVVTAAEFLHFVPLQYEMASSHKSFGLRFSSCNKTSTDVSCVYFLGDRMGRTNLSQCPKTSTFSWTKLQSALLTHSVNNHFWFVHLRNKRCSRASVNSPLTHCTFTFTEVPASH